jgi:hypothetical protein
MRASTLDCLRMFRGYKTIKIEHDPIIQNVHISDFEFPQDP